VNRASYALKTYPDAPATESALAVLVRAYGRLGMSDLRDDALRVFKTNFPKSPQLNDLEKR
jgi:outer membrane protein assembly factor BamD